MTWTVLFHTSWSELIVAVFLFYLHWVGISNDFVCHRCNLHVRINNYKVALKFLQLACVFDSFSLILGSNDKDDNAKVKWNRRQGFQMLCELRLVFRPSFEKDKVAMFWASSF